MLVVDVREPIEFNEEHVEGSVNLPLSELIQKSRSFLENNLDDDIVIMCLAGVRAEKARQYWIELGADPSHLRSYPGGLRRWKAEGNPTFKPQG